MIENIQLINTDKKITVQIDNETNELPIKQIKKAPTFINLNQALNTALYDDIIIDATLCYINNSDNDDISETSDDTTNDFHYNYYDIDAIDNTIDVTSLTSFLIPSNKELKKINIDGVVTIKIYNDNNIYYNADIHFTKGDITNTIPNELPLGEYKCDIIYAGNKFFMPYTLTINFNVERRLAICSFDTSTFEGHLTETLNIHGVLKDANTKNNIAQCQIQYEFDGQTFTTTTDDNGNFNIIPTIPDAHILHCNQLMIEEGDITIELGEPYEEQYDEELIRDDDGNIVLKSDIEEDNNDENIDDINNANTQDSELFEYIADNQEQEYQNTSYIITMSTNSDAYYLNSSIKINVIKAPTYITINTGEYNSLNRTVDFNGYIMANTFEDMRDAHYGKVQIYFPSFNYTHDLVKVDSHGYFTTNINMADLYAQYNNTIVDELIPYQGYNNIYDTSIIVSDNNEYNIATGDSIVIETNIKTITNELVTDGMVKFDLYYQDEASLVYTYATEIDNAGVCVFMFNTSRSGNYILKAQYVGLFGYKNSEKIINITVED